jgi:3-hydroxyacyl-[acyl-carrier-protein] dehydratase
MKLEEVAKLVKSSSAVFTYPMHLNRDAIQRFIPHREPMLFADSVTVLAHDHYTGEASWPADSYVFKGHFPGKPIVPGVMIVEAGAQIAGAGLRAGDPKANASQDGNIGLLLGIRKCMFRRPVTPGQILTFDMHTREFSENVVNVTGEVTCGSEKVATLEFVFAQAPASSLQGDS